MAKEIPMLKLNNGVEMPALGFGTFTDENVPGEIKAAVLTALDAGYRHLDCAWYYQNESEVGSALKTWLSQNPSVLRKDLFITTKVWPHLMEPEDVEWSLNNSLGNLGLEYVDAFLIHWPFAVERTEDRKVKLGDDGKYILKNPLTANLEPTWRAMEKLYTVGKTRTLGASNFTTHHLTSLLSYASVPPSINQIEIHPYFPNTALLDFCFSHSILPVAYSPLGSQNQLKSQSQGIQPLTKDEILLGLAEKKGVSLAQVCISWGLKRGYAVVPTSRKEARIRENFRLAELSENEMRLVESVKEGRERRFVNPVGMFGFDNWAGEK
ncbi:aldehyde reductase I [Tricladium varicosporioides]|nr:aldehyde reductase I [Hymenoscyphus varicosporioides]